MMSDVNKKNRGGHADVSASSEQTYLQFKQQQQETHHCFLLMSQNPLKSWSPLLGCVGK
jgi:hypothetical protein